MKILYTSSGEASLLYREKLRSVPTPERICECARFLSEVRLGNERARASVLSDKDIRALVSRCEPARFMLLRELIRFMKDSILRESGIVKSAAASKRVCIRFSAGTSDVELLALGLLAIYCGAKEIILSADMDTFTKEHTLSARLLGGCEVWLCPELECVARAAFSHPCDLIFGNGSEEFCAAAGLVSGFVQTAVNVSVSGKAFVLLHPYDIQTVALDVKRELSEPEYGQILLIASKGEELASALSAVDSERFTLLITSSDEESIAVTKKLSTFIPLAYGGENTEFLRADNLPPIMRESLFPCSSFGLLPTLPLNTGGKYDGKPSIMEFASAISRYVEKGMSGEDKETFAARL